MEPATSQILTQLYLPLPEPRLYLDSGNIKTVNLLQQSGY